MHITNVLIQNFQKHERLEISLSPDANAIVGTGDRGKSAIVRAIKWCLTNQPDGNEYIRFWYETDEDGNETKVLAKKTVVELTLSTGYVIRRIRTPKTNNYEIIDPKGEKTVLANFRKTLRKGQLVPDLILEATGVKTITLGEQKNVCVQIQDQHDPPFLIGGLSAPARWRAFSHLAGTEAADKTHYSFNSDIHNAGREIKLKGKSLETDRLELSVESVQLKKVEERHDRLAVLRDKIVEAQKLHAAIDKLIAKGMAVNVELRDNRASVDVARAFIDKLTAVYEKVEEATETWRTVRSLDLKHEQTTTSIEALTAELDGVKQVAALEMPVEAATKLRTLIQLTGTMESSESRLGDATATLAALQPVIELSNNQPNITLHNQLCNLLEEGKRWRKNEKDEKLRLLQATKEAAEAEAALLESLREAGQCPRCRQPTDQLNHSSCT